MSGQFKLPDDNVNLGEATPWRDFLALMTYLFISLFFLLALLEFLGPYIVRYIDFKTEARFFSIFRSQQTVAMDERPTYLNELVTKIIAHQDKIPKDFPFNVKVICSDGPNAFAVPGGEIIVTSALLQSIKTENGLAFVLGHELGHFYLRHHLRSLGRNLLLTILSSFLGGSEIFHISQLINGHYSRKDEAQADLFAEGLLISIYGHSLKGEEFFDYLMTREKVELAFLQRHPLTEERLKKLKTGQKVYKGEGLIAPLKDLKINCP